MNTFKIISVPFVTVLFLVIALSSAASDPARGPVAETARDSVLEDQETLSIKPVVYKNEGQDFQITFPGGCAKLVTRSNSPDLFGDEKWEDIIQVTNVYCDRYQETGEGCSVTANFNMHGADGSIAGPGQVTALVEAALAEYGAKIISQKTIRKEFENGVVVEGVEVLAGAEMGPGEVWVRGLLVEGDIYILTAWDDEGKLWKDPDYINFFNSFQPWVD